MGNRIPLLIVIFLITSNSFANSNETYVDQLIAKARAKQIWTKRGWQVLMHYSSPILGANLISFVDDRGFFLSPKGKTSPQAEMEATLKHLFMSIRDEKNPIACRFPARVAWLTKILEINKQLMPNYPCTHLDNWLNKLDADGVTLVFPVSVLNSPASMFGHTFLRLDRKAKNKPDLLAWTVNYAARSERERGLGFAMKGLFGGYQGKFSLVPYYVRVKEYSDIESRDMWEYHLNFNQDEIRLLLLHLWELLPIYSDYFFIDENCAFQLLTFLEAARPTLNLSSQFSWDAAPAETVRAITRIPGLLKKVNYRPASR